MASTVPPVRGAAFSFEAPVFDTSGKLKTGAAFSASQRSLDGGAYGAMTNAPAEIGASGTYTIALTAAEMTADRIDGRLVVSTASCQDVYFTIFTSANRIDDLATPATVWTNATRILTSSGGVSYTGPVSTSGDVSIVIGDDYKFADGRQLPWATTVASTWPDLTGATVRFNSTAPGLNAHAMTIVAPSGATKSVYLELTRTETAALAAGQSYSFNVQATLSNGDIVTLVKGTIATVATP